MSQQLRDHGQRNARMQLSRCKRVTERVQISVDNVQLLAKMSPQQKIGIPRRAGGYDSFASCYSGSPSS